MRVHVTWPDQSESELTVATLRELDQIVGRHIAEGARVDLKPASDGVRMVIETGDPAQ